MFDDLLAGNQSYAKSFSLKGLAPRAAKGLCVLTCMDTRIEPLAMLGIKPGDAKILRNAGGRVTQDVLRSLVMATGLLGVTRIAVIQHTNCAMAGQSDDMLRSKLDRIQAAAVADWELLAMEDPDKSLAEDVASVRACPGIPSSVAIEGWRYDVETGSITRLVIAEEFS